MNYLEQFKEVKTFIFDVDGVLTNSQVLVTELGEQLRSMNIKDGYAIKKAVRAGYRVCIITGGSSEGVVKRLEGLEVEDIFWGVSDKVEVFLSYVRSNKLDTSTILYMGDDLPDYQVMRLVGLPTCPADAAQEILEVAQYASPKNGGAGAVRDVIEKVLKLNNQWVF